MKDCILEVIPGILHSSICVSIRMWMVQRIFLIEYGTSASILDSCTMKFGSVNLESLLLIEKLSSVALNSTTTTARRGRALHLEEPFPASPLWTLLRRNLKNRFPYYSTNHIFSGTCTKYSSV